MLDFATQRHEICRIGRSMFERGLVHGSAGTISMRVSDGYLVTAGDACLGFIAPEQLAHTDDAGRPRGAVLPARALALHRAIYAADPGARCVVDAPTTELTALSLAPPWQPGDALPPLTPRQVVKVGHLPPIPWQRPGLPAAATRVADAIGASLERRAPIRAALLERVGPIVWEESPAAAMAVLEELEHTARLWRIAVPRPTPLDEALIDELRSAAGARW